MKVLPFKIPKPEQDAIVFQIDDEEAFYDKLHQHEEIQLSFIVKGEGTLIVGDAINHYSEGDIFVIGSHLPHVFKSDTAITDNSLMFTLFFSNSSFGSHFFELEELKALQPFFKRSRQGFKVTSKQNAVKDLFFQLEKASKFNRFMILFQLLKIISTANYKSLSSFVYDKKFTDNEGSRIRNVFEFTMNHFKSEITLDTIAEVANMTKNAFCKYFKKRTNKSYFTFLNELRIEQACKLLVSNKELSIAVIAELSGFNNLSNFNRQFQSIKHQSPSEFKKSNKL